MSLTLRVASARFTQRLGDPIASARSMARQWAMREDPACNSSQRMTSRVRTDICRVLSLGTLINKSTYTRQPDLIRVGYIVSEVADVLEILVGMIYSVGWGGVHVDGAGVGG